MPAEGHRLWDHRRLPAIKTKSSITGFGRYVANTNAVVVNDLNNHGNVARAGSGVEEDNCEYFKAVMSLLLVAIEPISTATLIQLLSVQGTMSRPDSAVRPTTSWHLTIKCLGFCRILVASIRHPFLRCRSYSPYSSTPQHADGPCRPQRRCCRCG